MTPPSGEGCSSRYLRLTADGVAFTHPVLLTGVVFKAAASGDTVTLYDGRGSSERAIVVLTGLSTVSTVVSLVPGLRLERGVYVDFSSSSGGDLTLFYVPVDDSAEEQ